MDFETLYNDFVAALKTELPENCFTRKQLAEDTGISIDRLRGILGKLVEQGVLHRELRVINGHKTYVYTFAGEYDKDSWDKLLRSLDR